MTSRTTKRFRKAFENLPQEMQQRARRAFELWKAEPYHPSLRFKQIHSSEPIFSVRIGQGWRAFGLKEGETLVWFWVGSHSEYNEMISKL